MTTYLVGLQDHRRRIFSPGLQTWLRSCLRTWFAGAEPSPPLSSGCPPGTVPTRYAWLVTIPTQFLFYLFLQVKKTGTPLDDCEKNTFRKPRTPNRTSKKKYVFLGYFFRRFLGFYAAKTHQLFRWRLQTGGRPTLLRICPQNVVFFTPYILHNL